MREAKVARVDLNVPFSEKDRAKALGARWDAAGKTWFVPDGVNPEPFAEWIEGPSAEFNARSDRYFIAKGMHSCWKCGKDTTVFGFLLPPGHEQLNMDDDDPGKDEWVSMDDYCTVDYVEKLLPAVLSRIRAMAPRYQRDFSKTTQDSYFMNHCDHCGMKQGDFNLFSEPGSCFFPTNEAEAAQVELIEVHEEFACSAGIAMGDACNLLGEYGRLASDDPSPR